MNSSVLFVICLMLISVMSSPFTDCNYRGKKSDGRCICEPEFTGEKCEHRNTENVKEWIEMFEKNHEKNQETQGTPSYANLGPKNCIKGVGCTYDVNWNVGFATVTYYGAGCTDPFATTGKCGTACRKGVNAQYTAAIPLAYWPPIRYGNCPTCGLDCLWDKNVLHNGEPLCFELTPYYTTASGLPTKSVAGKKIVVHVTDSCGGNCPPGPPGSKGSCNGSSSPDCGNTALYEGIQAKPEIPFKVYVGDDYTKPNPAGQGYRCPDAWHCSLYGTKYWSPCSQDSNSVSAPGFLDWCAGNNMHIDVNTESSMIPLQEFCAGVSVPGNDATCMAKYTRVPCGPIQEPPARYARGYSHWDNPNSRNVWCCQKQSWGSLTTCAATGQGLPDCSVAKIGEDCFQTECKA